MKLPALIAKHFREVYQTGNWTASNLRELVADLSWEEATRKVDGLNTIAALVYHTTYYVRAATDVLQGKPLKASDKFSFDVPEIRSPSDWEQFLEHTWKDVALFESLIETMPEERLWEDFSENKYGDYYRNLQGIIEHTYYHLGQVALIKKMIRSGN